jgi:hypothetical protein
MAERKLIRSAVDDYVHNIMKTHYGMVEGTNGVLHTEDAFSCDKLLMLVPGRGCSLVLLSFPFLPPFCNIPRAGIWSHQAIFVEGLHMGTMLPYVQKAKSLG